jgi:tRNA-specific 2-thiouridylase
MSIESLGGKMVVEGKIRYNQQPVSCEIEMVSEDLIKCTFHEKVRAATPGQALVLYDGDYVLGGGTIIKR